MDDLHAIVADLVRMKNVTGVQEIAERHLRAGDAAFVADLGIALWQVYGRDSAPWQHSSVFDHLLRLMILTPGTIEQALRLISVIPHGHQSRYVAALLASAHSGAELEHVFKDEVCAELRACLLHELVLRGGEV